jgi:Fe-S-cluster containining protein
VNRLPVLRNNERAICGRCEGACCKRAPGEAHPIDFGAPDRARMRESLFEALSSGYWAIDWWEGDPHRKPRKGFVAFDHLAATLGFRIAPSGPSSVEFVRAAQKGHVGRLHHGTWGGSCALLGENGCALEFKARPLVCRALIPGRRLFDQDGCDGEMAGGWDKRAIAIAWMPYQDVLREVAERIERQSRAAG